MSLVPAVTMATRPTVGIALRETCFVGTSARTRAAYWSIRNVRATALYRPPGNSCEQLRRLVGIDPRRQHRLLLLEQPTKNASQRFDRLRLAEDDFGKAAAALAVEIERHVAQFGRRRRLAQRSDTKSACEIRPAKQLRRQSFQLIRIHLAIVLPPCEVGYGGVKS